MTEITGRYFFKATEFVPKILEMRHRRKSRTQPHVLSLPLSNQNQVALQFDLDLWE